jgi:RNA polymerase sigma-70 factor (ECF subfamily)
VTSQEKLFRFEDRISPHLNSAYNLAKWMTHNHEDAEDIVQEAFVRAFSAIESLRGDDAKPWLLAIVRNTCLTRLKRERRATTIALEDQLEELSEASPDPEETLLISSNHQQVRNALEQLPADFREVIVLREMEGLTYREIAMTIRVPIGTVMSRLSRGRDWLRRLLSSPSKELA